MKNQSIREKKINQKYKYKKDEEKFFIFGKF